ncbi:hypothetical protein FE633_03930 [Streptomyces montanus]|uniref:Uncharacterized protein n=1 Tax=Streptomyces montanus TaxID=2580423 RepID=A0A5R9G0C9_9ACTN|nr:hypothetical protein [Streptomyces montanus]TLS47640.1 hypothetical protein FE633_03930 [Streptomyces montanus]
MSQEAVPSSQPKSLLQQMEELMAVLNANLARLDADLPSSPRRPAPAGTGTGARTDDPDHT